jgi:spore germination cell wall hydrolase CwlJ-like protein
MHNKAMLGWPILLLSASCVPAAFGQQLAMNVSPVAAPAKPAATPGFQTISLPVAAEEPPPPEVMADEIAVGSPARPFDMGPASANDFHSALDCLTAAVYYEARSESEDGQRAVAQVVLNRVRHPAFPKSVCGVVYQGSNRATGCQFSFTCDGSLARGREPGPWDRARRIAAQALAGYVYEPVGLATHYHTTAIHPWWADAMTKAVTIGAHVFYRWHGEWGDPKSFQRPYVGAEAFARAAAEPIGNAPEAPAEAAFGVAVHRAAAPAVTLAEVDDGAPVRIHRTGAQQHAAASADAPEGVRIHRSSDQPDAPALASTEAPAGDPVATR